MNSFRKHREFKAVLLKLSMVKNCDTSVHHFISWLIESPKSWLTPQFTFTLYSTTSLLITYLGLLTMSNCYIRLNLLPSLEFNFLSFFNKILMTKN